jgi:hypothetical protein
MVRVMIRIIIEYASKKRSLGEDVEPKEPRDEEFGDMDHEYI